jgi:hypothetical protein
MSANIKAVDSSLNQPVFVFEFVAETFVFSGHSIFIKLKLKMLQIERISPAKLEHSRLSFAQENQKK